ncbi:hypothetical protein F5Y16DRAFT_367348 [Xylariaceae sp. FL0255]|nr:hypothetical protein F5Y16DRAFT_367348 [Xylariaceae sp. FL0255]
MRSSHRKSRFGCKECKRRDIRCDEAHPSCRNCCISKRPCSFAHLKRSWPAQIQPQTPRSQSNDSIEAKSSEPLTPKAQARYEVPGRQSLPHGLLHEDYSILHFQLLHHVEQRLSSDARDFIPKAQDLFKRSMIEALKAGFLMDILVAVAAAHKSLLPGEDADFYRTEAMKLMTRSLAKFNTQSEITEDHAMAAFLYTMLLGQYVIFDIFSQGEDFTKTLNRFVQCMKLHHGIRDVLAPVWHKVNPVMGGRCQLAEWWSNGTHELGERGSSCLLLWELLGRSDVSSSSRQVYSSTVEALQMMFDNMSAQPSNRMAVVQEWLVRVPMDFVDLIGQRRPEALIILAHYAVLLHHARGFWAVGSAGRFLIQSITSYLGEYWFKWLEWPNEILDHPLKSIN